MKTQVLLFCAFLTPLVQAQQSSPNNGITIRADQVKKHPGKIHALAAKNESVMIANDQHPADEGDTVDVGFGFNVFTGELLNTQCMVGDEVPDDPADHQVASASGAIKQVTNLTQYRTTSNTSGSASLTYKIFSVGGGASAYSTDFFQSYYRYLTVDEQAVNRSRAYKNAGATRLVSRYSAQHFAEACGQMYVQKVLYGSSLHSLVQLATIYKDTETHHDADLSVGISAFFNAGASTQSSTTEIKANSAFSQLITVIGVPHGTLPDLDSLIQFAYNFPNAAKDGDQPVAYVLKSYKTAANPPWQAVDVPEATLQLIGNMAEDHDEAVQEKNDLRYAKGKTGKLYAITETQRQSALDNVQGFLNAQAVVVDKCEKQSVDACTAAIQGLQKLPTVDLPRVP